MHVSALVVAGLAGLASLTSAACKPDLDQRSSQLGEPVRVLAVQSVPAEAEPRGQFTLNALVVDGQGAVIEAPSSLWAFCTARKPLAELGPVSPSCYKPGHDEVFKDLGTGTTANATMPNSACQDFGPEVPVPKPGEPYGRPVDPDPTGGYYQPVTFVANDGAQTVTSVDTTRIACGVSGASSDDVITFRQRYHLNENPEISGLAINGAAVVDDVTPVDVAVGTRVTFHVTWPACPQVDACGDGICGPDESRIDCAQDCGKPVGCKGSERYLNYDSEARQLKATNEAMRVSWFSSSGAFDVDRSGRESFETEPSSDNTWIAPATPGMVRGWVVVRDERGGVAWRGFTIQVR